jgi:hypothetical protein
MPSSTTLLSATARRSASRHKMACRIFFPTNTLAPYIVTALIHRPKRVVYLSSGIAPDVNPTLEDMLWEERKWQGSEAYAETKFHDVPLAFAVARLWPGVLSNALELGWCRRRCADQKLQMIWRKATVHKSGWPSVMTPPHSSRGNTFTIKSAFHVVPELGLWPRGSGCFSNASRFLGYVCVHKRLPFASQNDSNRISCRCLSILTAATSRSIAIPLKVRGAHRAAWVFTRLPNDLSG